MTNNDVGLQAVDHRAGLLARAPVRLLDGHRLAGLLLPLIAERLVDVFDLNTHASSSFNAEFTLAAFHSTKLLISKVTSASTANSEATAKAAAKLYSL